MDSLRLRPSSLLSARSPPPLAVELPYFRWRRFAVVAAHCILAVRAVIVQLAFFLHIHTFVFRRLAVFSRPLIFATAFMTFFSVVIALFKDIPDIEGDRIFGIRSLISAFD